MRKILPFKEVSCRALDEIAKEEDLIRKGLKKPEHFQGPILYGVRDYVFLPVEKKVEGITGTTKDLYDVVFHTQKRTVPWKKLKPFVQGKFIIYPIAAVPNPKITEIDDDFIYPFMYNLYRTNPSLITFTVSNPDKKEIIEDGRLIIKSPALDFFRVSIKEGVEIKELRPDFHMTENYFLREIPKEPEKSRKYFQKARDQVIRKHSAPSTYA